MRGMPARREHAGPSRQSSARIRRCREATAGWFSDRGSANWRRLSSVARGASPQSSHDPASPSAPWRVTCLGRPRSRGDRSTCSLRTPARRRQRRSNLWAPHRRGPHTGASRMGWRPYGSLSIRWLEVQLLLPSGACRLASGAGSRRHWRDPHHRCLGIAGDRDRPTRSQGVCRAPDAVSV